MTAVFLRFHDVFSHASSVAVFMPMHLVQIEISQQLLDQLSLRGARAGHH